MTRNITLKLDDAILEKARHKAVQQNQSLSQWVADVILQTVGHDADYAAAKRRAIAHLRKGYRLGGKPLTRDQAHERR